MADDVKDIRITDPYIKSLIAAEQERRGDATATLTAGRMIIERDLQLQSLRGNSDARRPRARQKATAG